MLYFFEQGSSASHMTTAKVIDVIARLPDCVGQTADAVFSYTKKNGGRAKIAQIPKSECPYMYMDTSSAAHKAKVIVKHRRSRGSSRTKLVRTHTCWPLVGKTVRRSSIGSWMGKIARIENACLFIESKDYSCRKTWTTSKSMEEARISVLRGRN